MLRTDKGTDIPAVLEAREAEKQRLSEAVDEFAVAMKARLYQKVDEGYGGWDTDIWNVGSRIKVEVEELLDDKSDIHRRMRKSVDIANFLMFWHYRMLGKDA